MISSDHHRLLEDTLCPSSLADSLAATRRGARQCRVRRRTVRAAGAVVFVLAMAFVLHRMENPGAKADIAVSAPATPAFVLVTTGSPKAPALRTLTVPAGLIVSTRAAPHSIPRASRDDLFAFAGSRPAGLHHLPDGTDRWMWLDESELP